jgi:peptidoglycan glycosyltransferase
MASTPTYDPNGIVDPETGAAYFQSLLDRPAKASALLDRASRGVYTPGSVLKMVTAVAGLGSDAITPETVYPTQPAEEKTGMPVEGFKVRDGHHPQTGDEALALTDATAVSCNIYFAHTGLEVGGERFLTWGARLGFGAPIPFDVPTAASTLDGGDGFVDDVELANAAYGQGEAQATPLQMALVAATIAQRGSLMTPHVVDGLRSADGSVDRVEPSLWRQVIDRGRADSIARAMRAAVESKLGRPYAGKAKIPGVPTAGKSGTAELGGKGEPDSWFIGFAPADDPKIAVAVIVEGGGTGSEAAVPIGGQLMGDWLDLAP